MKLSSLRFVALGLGLAALAGYGVMRLFPLQFLDTSDRLKLQFAGLRSISSPAGDAGVEWRSPECRALDSRSDANSERCTCVVLVHGMGDSVLTWRKILTRRDWLASNRAPLRLIAWDLPGHGKTPEPASNPSGELQLRAQVMAQRLLGATQSRACGSDTIWVGNSLGGWVSSWVALKRPDQVKSLILLAPAGLTSQRVASLGSGVLSDPTVESLKSFRQQAYAKPPKDYPDWVWRAAVERVKKSPVRRVRGAQKPEDDLDQPIRRLSAPTRIIWGKADRILPLDKSAGFREIPARSLIQWQEVEACGHLPQKECPSVVTDAIIQSLQASQKR